MEVRDRIRPWKKTTYTAKYDDFTVQFELDHHQLWEINEIKDGKCRLSNSSGTMRMVVNIIDMHKIFDIDTVTRGRYSGRWDR